MERYLIMNTDDFGQCSSVNEAIFELLSEGYVSSATIMPCTPGFEEAASWCIRNRISNVGLHLTLTSEWENMKSRSLTHGTSLEDERGYLYPTCEAFGSHAIKEEVIAEIKAQFERCIHYGLQLSHADNHMGSLYGLAGECYLPYVFELCAAYGKLPFRFFRNYYKDDFLLGPLDSPEMLASFKAITDLADQIGILTPDYLLTHPYAPEPDETYESFKKMMISRIYRLPKGISETYIHPSLETDEIKHINPTWQRRVHEYELMKDEDYRYALKDAGIKQVTYRDIAGLRGM
jgi:chitin disaccharide deacetylase